jgi:hypothetical protein
LLVGTGSTSRMQMLAQAPPFGILGAVMLVLYLGWVFAVRAA